MHLTWAIVSVSLLAGRLGTLSPEMSGMTPPCGGSGPGTVRLSGHRVLA